MDPDKHDAEKGNPIGYTRRSYSSLFKSTGRVLPCGLCRESYLRFVQETPIDDYLDSRSSIFEWLFKIHNKVNEKLGIEPESDLKKISQKYERFRASCPKSREAKGCVDPAGDKKKMNCRLVIEPFENRVLRINILVLVCVCVVGLYVLFVLGIKKRRG